MKIKEIIWKRLLIEFYSEWGQFDWRKKFNWYSFTVINCYFENDMMCPGYEFEFIILGIGIRIRYNKPEMDVKVDKWVKETEETAKKHK